MSNAIYVNPEFDLYCDPRRDAEFLEQFGFIPGLKDFLMIRQVHALEHATVWMLSNPSCNKTKLTASYLSADNETIGGLSTENGFYLYGDIDPFRLRQAVASALSRLQQGEWDLALHPRCGTNSSVAVMLMAGMAITAHFTLPRDPLQQLLGMGLATLAANCLAPNLGICVQKYLTTGIPFNLKVEKITKITDKSGNIGYFVRLQWINNKSQFGVSS
ncbi:hypothetical protein IQ255_25210 [Pleurocapsales cyanobacterium LEGE 10410]|nr:hypothetical protein [Pleurocapsales cyanobacterium LEGE 10410]